MKAQRRMGLHASIRKYGRGVAAGVRRVRMHRFAHGASAGCRFCTLDILYYKNDCRPLDACHPNMYTTRYAGVMDVRSSNVVGMSLYVSTCRICTPTSRRVITVPPFLGEERSDLLPSAFLQFGRIVDTGMALRRYSTMALHVELSRLPAVNSGDGHIMCRRTKGVARRKRGEEAYLRMSGSSGSGRGRKRVFRALDISSLGVFRVRSCAGCDVPHRPIHNPSSVLHPPSRAATSPSRTYGSRWSSKFFRIASYCTSLLYSAPS
jgi:hypothetical protein